MQKIRYPPSHLCIHSGRQAATDRSSNALHLVRMRLCERVVGGWGGGGGCASLLNPTVSFAISLDIARRKNSVGRSRKSAGAYKKNKLPRLNLRPPIFNAPLPPSPSPPPNAAPRRSLYSPLPPLLYPSGDRRRSQRPRRVEVGAGEQPVQPRHGRLQLPEHHRCVPEQQHRAHPVGVREIRMRTHSHMLTRRWMRA